MEDNKKIKECVPKLSSSSITSVKRIFILNAANEIIILTEHIVVTLHGTCVHRLTRLRNGGEEIKQKTLFF